LRIARQRLLRLVALADVIASRRDGFGQAIVFRFEISQLGFREGVPNTTGAAVRWF
jgi:hypothetical protein